MTAEQLAMAQELEKWAKNFVKSVPVTRNMKRYRLSITVLFNLLPTKKNSASMTKLFNMHTVFSDDEYYQGEKIQSSIFYNI